MMDYPLLVRHFAERAETVFGDREIVSRTHDGIERSTYREVVTRARRLASALQATRHPARRPRRHLRLELAAPPRALPRRPEHGRRAAHAEHPAVRGRPALHRRPRRGPRHLPRRRRWPSRCPASRASSTRCSCPTARASARARSTTRSCSRPATRASSSPTSTRTRAAAMCYTSGTTGRPKGVVYSHRSTVLHTLWRAPADAMGVREADSFMPVVPMFHANAWGMPYACALAGARLVLPGPRMPPPALAELIGPSASPAPPACRRSGRACSSSTPRPTSRAARGHGRRLGRARGADPRLRRALRRARSSRAGA